MEEWFAWEGADLLLRIRVQPRANRDELAGVQGGHLRVRITAPPVGGKANTHLCRFLGGQFRVAASAVTLLQGETSRDKRLRITAPRQVPPAMRSVVRAGRRQ